MIETYEICKILVGTESFYKDNSQNMLVTAIDFYTQGQVASVEFDYKKVFDREDKYNDIVGFYHTHPSGCTSMSGTDVETMKQWVRCLGKALICLIECDKKLYSWIFFKDETNDIIFKEIKASTDNDINYNLWLEKTSNFWNSADFLLTEMEEISEVEILEDISDRLDYIETVLNKVISGLDAIGNGMQVIANSIDNLVEAQKVIIDNVVKDKENE